MASGPLGILGIIAALLVGAVAIGLIVILAVKFIGLLVRVIGHIFATIGRWLGDIFRLVGALVVAIVFVPLVLLNIVIGRWSAAAHFGRALTDECKTMGACTYRIVIGHPLHLVGLRGVTEGIEQRLPNAVAFAPGPDKPSKKRQGLFEGYTIVGSLPGGGSGGKLYVAEPDELKRAAYQRRGHTDIDRVVIKTFSLGDGSSLPQIVRESRALDAAKKLGLVLEHELTDERFYYIMRYVPGDSLSVVTQNMHAQAPAKGLDTRGIKLAVGYTTDLLEALDTYHRGGLWHKDVKPDNVIVDRETDPALGRGKAHLVDFGLITPLRSAMTLTTHGTEYFRDPELVRQALRGVKVHQIDGGRFDVYAAGAVLYSIVENSFPAHGGLSQVSKTCPEALRWIIRRAMTDYDKRYPSARAMLDDLQVVTAAPDPFAVKPADLPSMSGRAPEPAPEPVAVEFPEPEQVQAAASPVPPPQAPRPAAFAAAAGIPRIRVSDWWTGRYVPAGAASPAAPIPPRSPKFNAPRGFNFTNAPQQPARPLTPPEQRLSAKEQRERAQRRAAERRARAHGHRAGRDAHLAPLGPTARAGRRSKSKAPSAINAGIVLALIFLASAAASVVIFAGLNLDRASREAADLAQAEARAEVVPAPPGILAPSMPRRQQPPTTPSTPTGETSSPVEGLVPTPHEITDGLDIAMIVDFRPPFDEDFLADLKSARTSIEAADARAISNNFTQTLNGPEGVDTIARLLALRGQAVLDSELGADLSAFIAEDDDLEAVWWVGPGDNQTYRYLLASDSGVSVFEADAPRFADIGAALISETTP